MNIYYTLKNYKENYTNELNHFINDYEDNDEVDFWDEQRTLYQHCVKNVNIYMLNITVKNMNQKTFLNIGLIK